MRLITVLSLILTIMLFSPMVFAQEIQYRGFGGVTAINPTGTLVWYDSLMRSIVLDDENLVLAYDMDSMNIDSEIYDFSGRSNHGTMYPGLNPDSVFYNESSSADAEIDQNLPDNNYGSITTMTVQSWSAKNKRLFSNWSLSSIPTGSLIIDAQMVLYKTTDTGAFPRTYDAHKASSSWTESGLTWNNQPGVTGSAVSISITTAEGEYNWNITDFVQDWVDGTQTNYGVRVKDQTENSGSIISATFSSKEGANDPYLNITYLSSESVIPQIASTFGQARDFDGYDDYVNTGLDISPDNFTLTTVVNPNSYPSGGDVKGIISKWSGPTEWQLGLKSTGKLTFRAVDDTASTTIFVDSLDSIPLNSTSLIGLTWTGLTATFWIDGSSSGSFNRTGNSIRDTSVTIRLGTNANLATRYWDGPVDEVLIFTDVKTDLEMSYLTTIRQQVIIGGGSASVPQRYAGLILALPWLIVAGIMFTMFYIAFLAWRKSLKGEW